MFYFATGAANLTTGETRSYWQMAKTYFTTKTYNPLFMINNNKGAFGYHFGFLGDHPELVQEAVGDLFDLYRQGKIKPNIDSVWSFEDVSNHNGGAIGLIV